MLPDHEDALRSDGHKARWADWLVWSNLAQFLGQPDDSRGAVVAGSSQAASGDHDDLWLRYRAGGTGEPLAAPDTIGPAPSDGGLSDEQREELELVDDEEVRALAAQVLGSEASAFVAGHETTDGLVVEAAWPEVRVGILRAGDEVPAGWDARPVTGWTVDELRSALRGGD